MKNKVSLTFFIGLNFEVKIFLYIECDLLFFEIFLKKINKINIGYKKKVSIL